LRVRLACTRPIPDAAVSWPTGLTGHQSASSCWADEADSRLVSRGGKKSRGGGSRQRIEIAQEFWPRVRVDDQKTSLMAFRRFIYGFLAVKITIYYRRGRLRPSLLMKAPSMKGINSIRRPRLALLFPRLPYDVMMTFHPVKRTLLRLPRIARVTAHVPTLFFTLLLIPRSSADSAQLFLTLFHYRLCYRLLRLSCPVAVPHLRH
jgi:hypothetical protein